MSKVNVVLVQKHETFINVNLLIKHSTLLVLNNWTNSCFQMAPIGTTILCLQIHVTTISETYSCQRRHLGIYKPVPDTLDTLFISIFVTMPHLHIEPIGENVKIIWREELFSKKVDHHLFTSRQMPHFHCE